MGVSLREVLDSDLPAFWGQLKNPDLHHMAGVTRDYHYDRVAFDRHWAKVRADDAVTVRTVLNDGIVVGHAAMFGTPREVTYVVDPAYWGRGIATAALAALIELEDTRPLHADAVADNLGSIRVLEKCGFVVVGRERCFARARNEEIDVVQLVLK